MLLLARLLAATRAHWKVELKAFSTAADLADWTGHRSVEKAASKVENLVAPSAFAMVSRKGSVKAVESVAQTASETALLKVALTGVESAALMALSMAWKTVAVLDETKA